ncbi:hypothetical protein TNCV_4931151 [Trichonephila clavipes]|nr:hypothetical protein TNCV_4931151 [Trichonephila clavipes]
MYTFYDDKDANRASKKLFATLISFLGKCHTDPSGLLQYLHNGISNASGIDFLTVPSSIKYRKLIVDLFEKCDASNPTALLTAHTTGSSISNKVTLEIDSHSNSINESVVKCSRTGSSYQRGKFDLRLILIN